MRPAGRLTSEARNTIVRRLLERDARAYRAVLLEALIVHPESFPRHYQEEMSRPLEDIERQLAAEIVLGAWIKDELVGIVAFAAKSFPKQRHAGTISHLYVKERFRRKGVAGLLLGAVLESAAHHVEQVEIIVSDITIKPIEGEAPEVVLAATDCGRWLAESRIPKLFTTNNLNRTRQILGKSASSV